MSVNFNPNSQSASPKNPPIRQCPSAVLMAAVNKGVHLVCEGFLKETMSPKQYCERAWVKQTGKPPSEITEVFMKSCVGECQAFKECFFHW